MSELALKVEGLTKSFEMGGKVVPVLKGVDLEVKSGERIAIVGQSGSGKSTFLHVIGTLDQPTSGQVFLHGKNAFARADAELDTLRNRHIGFVFQFHHLLPDQDAVHNVMIPALIGGMNADEARARAEGLLQRVGLGDRMDHRPGELSGGEQQRVALARALVRQADLVLLDDVLSAVDHVTERRLVEALQDAGSGRSVPPTVVIVSHRVSALRHADSIVVLDQGMVVDQGTHAELSERPGFYRDICEVQQS